MTLEDHGRKVNSNYGSCFVREISCPELNETEIEQAIALVNQSGIPESYIRPRLRLYDAAIMVFNTNTLLALQLIQTFNFKDEVYVYFGPAFSREGAILQLYGWYIRELDRKYPEQNIYILAEVQNPNMLLLLHGLFGAYGFSFLSKNIPAEILATVPEFCRRYNHIGKFRPDNFTTNSDSTLFKRNSGGGKMSELMVRNGISLSGGDNMVFSAKIEAGLLARPSILNQVKSGITKVGNWIEFKNSFLENL